MQQVADAEVAFAVNDCMRKICDEALETISDRGRPAAELFGRLATMHGQAVVAHTVPRLLHVFRRPHPRFLGLRLRPALVCRKVARHCETLKQC